MSKDHIVKYIVNRMSPTDLIERLEPYITTEELTELLGDVIETNFHEAFDKELEEYYGEQ